MDSGRQREAAEIVRYKRAAAVGQLLLGELDGPMEPIFVKQYLYRPRRDLKTERAKIRAYLRGEIAKFCRDNFEDIRPQDLAKLYEPLFEHGSVWYLPLADFLRDFGRFKTGVLKGAPLHATVHISPWGLQTDFPEHHLMRDLAVSFNEVVEIEEHRLTSYRTKTWREKKRQKTRAEIADLIRRSEVNQRTCILSCFNLIEAYINGLAWDYVQTHDISDLPKKKQNLLTESERPVSIIDKLIKVPRLVAKRETEPLHQTRDPLKSFIEVIKPYRDAIVHASPFAAPEKFGGYDKLSKIYELNLSTVRRAVDITIGVIGEIHRFVGGEGELPVWILPRTNDGRFIIEVDS
ncbi:MAG: hypothetical protein Kow0063_22110 [Anaerolineae bacterium]